MITKVLCPQCESSFDVPDQLADRAAKLHQRAQHAETPTPCEHDWTDWMTDGAPWGRARRDSYELACTKCDKRRLVLVPHR